MSIKNCTKSTSSIPTMSCDTKEGQIKEEEDTTNQTMLQCSETTLESTSEEEAYPCRTKVMIRYVIETNVIKIRMGYENGKWTRCSVKSGKIIDPKMAIYSSKKEAKEIATRIPYMDYSHSKRKCE